MMTVSPLEGFMNRAHTIPFSKESAIAFQEGLAIAMPGLAEAIPFSDYVVPC
jgi:hypothetical protein